MKKDERDELRHEVYALWYNAKDKNKKNTYQKILNLIDYTEDLKSQLKSIQKLFNGMV